MIPIRNWIFKTVIADLKRKYKVSKTVKLTPELLEMAEQFDVKEELKKAKESQKKNGE